MTTPWTGLPRLVFHEMRAVLLHARILPTVGFSRLATQRPQPGFDQSYTIALTRAACVDDSVRDAIADSHRRSRAERFPNGIKGDGHRSQYFGIKVAIARFNERQDRCHDTVPRYSVPPL